MKKLLVPFVAYLFPFLLLTCSPAAAEATPQLQNLKHSVLSPSSEQVVLQLNGSYSPKVFTLKDENPRIIFDFADMTYGREIKGVTTTNGPIVQRIRVGRHTDNGLKTRIVFDVPTLKGVNYTHKFDEKTSSLIIQFTGPEKAVTPPKQTQATEGKKPAKTDASAGAPHNQAEKNQADKQEKTPQEAAPKPPAKDEGKTTSATTQQPAEATVPVPSPIQKPEKPGPQEETKAELPKAAPEVAAEKKTGEKPPSVQIKQEEKTETAQVGGEKKEGGKAESTIKESAPAPTKNAATGTKPEAPQTGDKSKTDTAKTTLLSKSTEGPQLEHVKFDASSPKGEMVLFKLNGFHPPAVHGVEEGIPRVICDFNNTKLIDATKSLIKTDGKFVKVIRISKTKKPEKVRVVIDLEPNRSYDLQQVFFKEDNLFVLIVNTVKK